MINKKMLTITLLLLAVLTIGAVSAAENNDFNETITAENTQETIDVSIDNDNLEEMSEEDVDIQVENIDASHPDDNFTTITVSEKDGNFVIIADHDGNSQEIYRDSLSESDKYIQDTDDNYCFGVSLNDVNTFISNTIDSEINIYDIIYDGDNIRFVLQYQDTNFVTKTYTVEFDNDNILLNEKIITEEDFNCWIPSHESINNEWATICDVDLMEVNQGTVRLTITKPNGDTQTVEKSIENDVEDDNHLRWWVEDFDIEETGDYTVNVTYSNDIELSLKSATLKLTQFDYALVDYVHVGYPFDVIRFYSEEDDEESSYIKVMVNGVEKQYYDENPYRWTLNDLDAGEANEYEITIEAYMGEELVENFTYTLNVNDVDSDDIIIYSNQLGYESWDLESDAVYFICPDGKLDQTFTIKVWHDENMEDVDEVTQESYKTWTLDDLGITSNGGYDVRVFDEEDNQISNTCFDVRGIISEESFDLWISTHEPVTADWDPEIVNVHLDNVGVGQVNIIITKPDRTTVTLFKGVEEANENNEIIWSYDELKDDTLDEAGKYSINITYSNGDNVIPLVEDHIFTLTQFDYNVREGDVYVDYPFDVIRIWDEDLNVEVYLDDDTTPIEPAGDNPLRWTLTDLDINSPGDYTITINATKNGDHESFSYTLNVYNESEGFIFYSNDMGVLKEEMDDPVLYLISQVGELGKTLTILMIDDDDNEYEKNFNVDSIEMSWTIDDLNITQNGGYDIRLLDGEDDIAGVFLNVDGFTEPVSPDVAEGDIYLDCESPVIRIYVPDGNSGKMEVIVNGNVMYITNVYPDREYLWHLKTLNITETGDYTLTVKFNEETIAENDVHVREFENDTFRVKSYYDEEYSYSIFCPEDAEGTIIVYVYDREQDDMLVETHEIPIEDKFKGKWTGLEFKTDYDLEENAFIEVEIDGNVIDIEENHYVNEGVGFEVYDDYEVVVVFIPYDRSIDNASINITSGEYSFFIELNEFEGYEWYEDSYKFALTKDDLNYFNDLSDKDVIKFVFVHEKGQMTRWMSIKKEEDDFSLYSLESSTGEFGDICAYGMEIIIEANTFGEDDEDEEESDEIVKSDYFATVSIPDSFNVINGKINIVSGENIIFSKMLSQINHTYLYNVRGNRYYISYDDLNLENIKDKDLVNITLTSGGEVIEYITIMHRLEDGNSTFYEYFNNLEFSVHYGELLNPEHGMSVFDGSFIYLMIPDVMNIDGGNILITRDDGTVLFNKSLDSFDNSNPIFEKGYSRFYQGSEYIINTNETIYSLFPENENLTFSFVYADKVVYHKGIVKDGRLYRIVVPTDVTDNMFEIIIPDNVLVNGNEFAVTIRNINANRQTIGIELGGEYFNVYVNGKRIEDLGRLNRYDGETELVLFRLCSNTDGVNELTIYLGDLDITENGVYDIRVTLTSHDGNTLQQEAEIFSQNVTLTSNVKAENASSELLTGFGIDPILIYLDTYYGDITSDVTGNITVLNSTGDEIIFISDIKTLEHDEKGYYLKYSDFPTKNFGDHITVMYEGNERTGNTTVNVTWKDVDPTDFTPVVMDNVDDYYGDLVNMEIPALITDGQIIVTIKFKNNHVNPIQDMNVTSNYDSQAVYTFSINQITNGKLSFSLSDLGFYVENGDYDVDVKFTADGSEILDVTNTTSNVMLSTEIDMKIDATSRYTKELPFASVKIYDPASASYAELFIDDVLYSHKTFDKGVINFTSSPSLTAGAHNAEIRVYNEFGTVIDNMIRDFETIVKSDDVEVTYEAFIKEGRNASLTINVAKEGEILITIDGENRPYHVDVGVNTLDLGVLSHGNHTIGIFYEEQLDDDNVSFYNGYITLTVDYESWITMPYPIVLNHDDTIRFDLGSDATGYVALYIDGEIYKNVTLNDGTGEIQIKDLDFGKYNFTLIYSGDEKHDSATQSGVIDVTFLFTDNVNEEGYPLMESYIVTITLPEDATGTVTLTVDTEDGQPIINNNLLAAGENSNTAYVSPVENGKATFIIKGLNPGEHTLYISYTNGNYPDAKYSKVLNVSYFAVIIDDDKKHVSLMLPENATGNLIVYNDNMKEELYSIPLINGKASVDLTKLTVGIYDIRAYYDGDDYDVRQDTAYFKVMPTVIIKQDTVIGENLTIFVDLDNSTGSLLIVLDGLSPALEEIVNGKVNYTMSTEEYFKGNHTATFYYVGNSFDGNVFYELDNKTGYFVPIKYGFEIQPIKVLPKVEVENEDFIEISIVDEDGNYVPDATGQVAVTILNKFTGELKKIITNAANGKFRIYKGGLPDGEYEITYDYYGDSRRSGFIGVISTSVKNKLPVITASDLSILYTSSKTYSATVYKKDGSLASGVNVGFYINDKAIGNAVTNAKGVAVIKISSTPGTYKITSTALGVTITKKLTVKKILSLKTVKVKKSAKKLIIKATLKKVDGKYLKGKKITFKFNGKKYTAKTDKKGMAKVTIKKKVLKKLKKGKKVKYQATFQKETVKKTAKVKK